MAGGPATHQIGLRPPVTGHRFLGAPPPALRSILAYANTCRFLFLLRTLTIESLAEVLPALSAHPLPTYLGGEKQRTCGNGLIWNIADGARPNPEGLSRSFRVDIDSMVG